MIPNGWTELAASKRLPELRRETEHQRLLRPGRPDGKMRRLGPVHRRGWVGLTRQGDQS